MLLSLLSLTFLCMSYVGANVEKQIFVAKPGNQSSWSDFRNSLIDRGIQVITPQKAVQRQRIHSAFSNSPILDVPKQAWFLLDDLEPGRRYEIRVSFGAMTPCDLGQTLLEMDRVQSDPEKRDELFNYLTSIPISEHASKQHSTNSSLSGEPILFHVVPRPNYFTTDTQLMNNGNIIEFEFTLDIYLGNIFPASLYSTAIYILVIACISFIFSTKTSSFLSSCASLETEHQDAKSCSNQNKND